MRELFHFLIASVLGGAGAFTVGRLGGHFGLVDLPNERSSHHTVTPKGGGVGILTAFVMASVWAGLPVLIWVPAAGLSLVSLFGDRRGLSAKLRLGLQFVAAVAACWGIAGFFPAGIFWRPVGLVLGLIVASFFVVATANIFNFMDGINGIAGITGVVAFSLLAWTGWMRGESSAWVLVATALAAACAGFLPWNFPCARVFMGDVGSILLGFVFALFVAAWSRTLADLLMFIAFLFPFYADEVVTLIPRLRDGDSLIQAHRRHVYQILVNQMVIPHWKISLLYGFIQMGVASGALLLHPLGWAAEIGWLGFVLVMVWVLASQVRRHEA